MNANPPNEARFSRKIPKNSAHGIEDVEALARRSVARPPSVMRCSCAGILSGHGVGSGLRAGAQG
jgi:hypothetical protein